MLGTSRVPATTATALSLVSSCSGSCILAVNEAISLEMQRASVVNFDL